MAKTKVAERSADTSMTTQDEPTAAQALAVKGSQALTNEPFLTEDMFEEYANAGHENVTAADIIIPRITILQALSPQINARKPEFIEGAQVGDICDVGMGEILPEPLWFVPCYYSKAWLEWAPRASGDGLVAIHKTPDILKQTKLNDRKQSILPNGNLISETAQFFGLNLSAGGRPSFLPMASTQLKKAKRWVNLTTSEKGFRKDGTEFARPMFYRSYKLSTVEEGNAQGDWIGWDIKRDISIMEMGADAPAIFDAARKFCDAMRRGDLSSETEQQMTEADQIAAHATVGEKEAA